MYYTNYVPLIEYFNVNNIIAIIWFDSIGIFNANKMNMVINVWLNLENVNSTLFVQKWTYKKYENVSFIFKTIYVKKQFEEYMLFITFTH